MGQVDSFSVETCSSLADNTKLVLLNHAVVSNYFVLDSLVLSAAILANLSHISQAELIWVTSHPDQLSLAISSWEA